MILLSADTTLMRKCSAFKGVVQIYLVLFWKICFSGSA
ncbi:hypothetical protein PVAP13_1KG479900 [Panicum virgatum]|uniref:Uncharacterized protein n=1 Tax=Panicum virgatum TaxID=38727 RepID=A0A8T0XMC8_PANVG|nr:hypothetical protein PVAP13_1KG479900 [Panicum virgatum]